MHTHLRAHLLLAERDRLGAAARRALYATVASLVASGLWWLGAHYAGALFANGSDDLYRLGQESLALRVHGATAFAMLFALGAMSAHHIRRGWSLKRNRVSGSVLITGFALLVTTGYALYYLVSDDLHAAVSALHWASGLALAPTLFLHIAIGRRSRPGTLHRSPGPRKGHGVQGWRGAERCPKRERGSAT